jgi:hypothetical protein
MDSDMSVRELPLLRGSWTCIPARRGRRIRSPGADLCRWRHATQQRVIDVLNALAGVGISSVTFTDLID